MEFQGFTEDDFEVFDVPGLELRMDALKTHLRPKLGQLGQDLGTFLSEGTGQPMYAHVAKHARRTVHPPKDSWVAFCHDKRGYKKHPHFQIGLWATHAFATFGLIYESPVRGVFAHQLQEHAAAVVKLIPPEYQWSVDHTDPAGVPAAQVGIQQLHDFTARLQRKQGELLVGIRVPRTDAVRMSPQAFETAVQSCFRTLLPLYRMAMAEEVVV